jgi:hypothetical protein
MDSRKERSLVSSNDSTPAGRSSARASSMVAGARWSAVCCSRAMTLSCSALYTAGSRNRQSSTAASFSLSMVLNWSSTFSTAHSRVASSPVSSALPSNGASMTALRPASTMPRARVRPGSALMDKPCTALLCTMLVTSTTRLGASASFRSGWLISAGATKSGRASMQVDRASSAMTYGEPRTAEPSAAHPLRNISAIRCSPTLSRSAGDQDASASATRPR